MIASPAKVYYRTDDGDAWTLLYGVREPLTIGERPARYVYRAGVVVALDRDTGEPLPIRRAVWVADLRHRWFELYRGRKSVSVVDFFVTKERNT